MQKLRRRKTQMNTTNSTAAIAQPSTELTLAESLNTILAHVISPESGEEATPIPQAEYDYVCSRLSISPVQAEIFAAIMELSMGSEASAESVAHKLGCTNLHFIGLRKDIDVLTKKRYIRCSTSGFNGLCFRVPDEAIKCIQANEVPDGKDLSGLSTTGIVRRMNGLFRNFWNDNIDIDSLYCELNDILRFNSEDTFVKEYEKFGISKMENCEQLLFLYMVTRRCAFGESSFGWDDFGRLFANSMDEDTIHSGVERGDLDLIRAKVIENVNNEGIVDNTQVCFVEDSINKILAKMPTSPNPAATCRNLIGKDTISEKELFYNENEAKQIDTLTKLLLKDNYTNVVARLKEKGMRIGFCALFHGKPGTGKTESVYQIARKTGRDIYLVDVSQLKSKWVGDSEKNVRELFREYKRIVRSNDIAPILLFNEADAVFGVRKKGAEDSVDKMNNSIQNIILQEMESLEGILIATTNLTSNLDEAFERRFLIKIEFHKPDTEARTHIWQSLVEGIDKSAAETLAKDFDSFSGGQIENISRKATVSYILSGMQPDIKGLRELCENETLDGKKKEHVRIGF